MTDMIHAGGCQCGAVRFQIRSAPKNVSICHCRMCQKAFGALYAPLVDVGFDEVIWTRGRPKHFQSSNSVQRGFCENCGTPLTYTAPDGVGLALGAFDAPGLLRPTIQFGVEAKVGYVDQLHTLPQHITVEDVDAAPYLAGIVSRQHPDHDTETWPPQGAS